MTGAPGRPGADDDPFDGLRPRLHGIAYRMTGSVSDADDLCQDAWLRWSTADRAAVRDPEAFLVTTVTRLAIDRLRSAARRREAYVGPYLPEPVVSDPVAQPAVGRDPADVAELADSLTFAFLVLLDELGPVERAVLLLHDVFGYSFDEVAGAVDRTTEAVRQVASRARRKVGAHREPAPTAAPDREAVQATIERLLVAVAAGDVAAVMDELAPDVVELNDGGAGRRAARRPVVGPERVARIWVNLARRAVDPTVRIVDVNGRLGIVLTDAVQGPMVMTADFDDHGRIRRIYVQLNPDKLAHLDG